MKPLSRRRILQLGAGGIVGLGTPFLAKALQKEYLVAPDFSRDFTPPSTVTSLHRLATTKNLLFGTATDIPVLSRDAEYSRHCIEQCGLLVSENAMKWRALRPAPDQFDFTGADALLNFALQHNLLLRGHTLVWHLALPDWFSETVNTQNAERYMQEHIQAVAGRYAGQIHSWDVVNEAIEEAFALPSSRSDGLRVTPWLEYLGEDYLELAFRFAAAADPNAILMYNDYDLEYDRPDQARKREAVLNMLERLISRGTPIHAFGFQSHLLGHETRFNPDILQTFVRDLTSLGLKIMVTELDVLDRDLPADVETRDRIVAAAYEDYLTVMLNEPSLIAVTTWGLSDRYSWLSEFGTRADGLPVRPLPLDENMQRKLAWNAIARAFDQARSSPDA